MADHDTNDADGAAAETSGAAGSAEAKGFAGTDSETDSSPAGGKKKFRMPSRGPLIAAGAVAAVVVAAVTAFFVLWPDPPGRSAGGGGTDPNAPVLRGTYHAHNDIHAPIGHYSNDHVLRITSACPGCDATATGDVGTGTLHWTGRGWEASAQSEDCGQVTSAFTIGPVINGITQELSSNWTMCDVNVTTTWTRTGD